MLQAPCKGCPDRHSLCHANCERYLDFRKELDEISHARRERIDIDYALKRLKYHRYMTRKGGGIRDIKERKRRLI